jgi:phage terminase large subunit-like protein
MGQRPRSERAAELSAAVSWCTACPDWEGRLLAGRSLVPDLPLFAAEAERALRIFKRLKLPDVVGTPTMAEACGEWFFPVVAALFGSYDPARNVRMIQEFFWLIPKGNSKSSNGGAVMVVALIVNRRPRAEFMLVAPTKEIATIAFDQADGTIRLDPELDKLFHTQRHIKTITHRKTGATLKIKAADTDTITGGKQLGTMIDETHVFAEKANAAGVFLELRGSLGKRADGFLFQATTQSKTPPAGVFAAELNKARAVRDGKIALPLLPILYELPERLSKDGGWKNRAYWPSVNPNLGRSLQRDFLERELMTAEQSGNPATLALFASQHFNVQIGTALAIDNWVGAQHW